MATNPNYYQYLMKLIPDYSYIDYAEKDYWQNVKSGENIWYFMTDAHALMANISFKINSYRCILVSPSELEFNLQHDQLVFKLKDYSDRHVYVFFQTDDYDKLNSGNYSATYKLKQTKANNDAIADYPYILEVSF